MEIARLNKQLEEMELNIASIATNTKNSLLEQLRASSNGVINTTEQEDSELAFIINDFAQKQKDLNEKRSLFIASDFFRTEEIIDVTEKQLALIDQFRYLKDENSVFRSAFEGIEGKRKALQALLTDNQNHLKNLQELKGQKSHALESYICSRPNELQKMKKENQFIKDELHQYKLSLETANLELESLRFGASMLKDRNRRSLGDQDRINGRSPANSTPCPKGRSSINIETPRTNLSLDQNEMLGMILMQSMMIEHQLELIE